MYITEIQATIFHSIPVCSTFLFETSFFSLCFAVIFVPCFIVLLSSMQYRTLAVTNLFLSMNENHELHLMWLLILPCLTNREWKYYLKL